MSCDLVRARFSALLDERLAARDRELLEAHLSTCARCRAELGRWRGASQALRASGPTPVPAGLAERAWRAAIERGERTSLAAWFVGPARRALVAGALVAGAFWVAALVARPSPSTPPPVEDPIELAWQLWAEEAPGDAR